MKKQLFSLLFKALGLGLCFCLNLSVMAQVQTYRKTSQELNDIDRLATAVPEVRYFNVDNGEYKIGNADGTLGAIPDRSAFITDTSGVVTPIEALNYWDTLLKQFFKATNIATFGNLLDRAMVWKTDSEITTINTGQTAQENLYYWDTTNSRYCKGLASGALDCWASCVPNCVNRTCGSDGCGGSCGVCLGVCTAGTCEVPAPTTQLVAYYPYTGNTNDTSGNNFNASNSGATLVADRNGDTNSAYSFDGANDTMATPIDETDLAVNNGRDFSVALWVRAEGWGTCSDSSHCSYNKIVISNRKGDRGFLFGFTGQGVVSPALPGQVQIEIGTGCDLSQVVSNPTLPFNTWKHVVMTLDYNETNNNSEVKMYIDGLPVSTKVRYATNCTIGPFISGGVIEQSNVLISSAASMRIGNDPYPHPYYYFDGQMDELAIYDRVLGALEVASLYNYYLAN